MSENIPLRIIAHIHSDFPTKFGIPRQSGLIHELKAAVVFEPEYRNPDALRGLEGYTYIWLIWQFSETARQGWSPTVRPPRLGGNTRMGVFASRSPFRPNPIGLSSVRLERIELQSPFGPILHVAGADLMDNTPIYDIKPYLPYVDSHPDAAGGFALQSHEGFLQVNVPSGLLERIPPDRRDALLAVLAQDPRPAYQNTPDRVYGMEYAGFEIRFTVSGHT
ncbi:tRNA (N6-threonylcarbamoyladenosine(37)-N6)-methyltransferase TrmO, partial [Anaerotruncus colihominis]